MTDTNVADENVQNIVLNQYDERQITLEAQDLDDDDNDMSNDTWSLIIFDNTQPDTLRETKVEISPVSLPTFSSPVTTVIFKDANMVDIPRKSSSYEIWNETQKLLFQEGKYFVKKKEGFN